MTLRTYLEPNYSRGPFQLGASGVNIHAAPRREEISFAYFHPLSDPAIVPKPEQITWEPSLKVDGVVVLRFGFLEGDAIVTADRAVYDPQSCRRPQPFAENGSRADTLAVVMNEAELHSAAGTSQTGVAVQTVLKKEGAHVLIVKLGVRGARVYQLEGAPAWIPPYRSPKVFKIGSGDVFSAAFAYYWGMVRKGAIEAADLASRSVAYYCSTSVLPLGEPDDLPSMQAIAGPTFRSILLLGSTQTLEGRWILEEARYCLNGLGLKVVAPAIDQQEYDRRSIDRCGSILVINDLTDYRNVRALEHAGKLRRPLTVLNQSGNRGSHVSYPARVDETDDFATALYFAGWAAAET